MDELRYVQYFYYFDSLKTPVSTAGTSSAFVNSGFDYLTLEVSGASAINMTVEGCVCVFKDGNISRTDDECSWTELPIKSLTNTDLSSITSDGIYNIPIMGISRIRVKISSISGSATITGGAWKL